MSAVYDPLDPEDRELSVREQYDAATSDQGEHGYKRDASTGKWRPRTAIEAMEDGLSWH